jgi:hypothetical protein
MSVNGRAVTMRSNMTRRDEASPPGFLRFPLAAVAFAALTLCGSVGFAEDEPADDSKPAASDAAATDDAASSPTSGDKAPHPHMDTAVPSDKDALAAKLSNPTAAVMAMKSFLDVIYYRGSAPRAHRASFTYSFEPAFPIATKGNKGNLIFRPLIPVQFGEPYIDSTGTVDTAVAFGNISLDSVHGKTWSNGLMFMAGVSTLFPTNSKPELRADWAFGPEAMIGHASKKAIAGALVAFTWSFPGAPRKQTVSGQYFWYINLAEGWQVGSGPTWSYSRETKITTFPLGIGARKVVVLGKKNQPVQIGAEAWMYVAQADALGPQWTLRITIAPVIPIPWGKI